MNKRTLARHRLTGSAHRFGRTSAEGGGGGQGGGQGSNDGGGQGGNNGQGGAGSNDSSGNDGGGSGGGTFTKDDVERIVGERLARDRAAADRKAQQANRTEAQRIEQLERDLAEERLGRVRARIAAKHGIGDLEDVLKGSNEEELESAAKRLADRLNANGKGGGSNRGGGRNGSGTSGKGRTVQETGGAALTPKQQAVQALRNLRGGGSSADD